MAESYVQVPPDSTGKKIDTSELTRADGTVVERQRAIIGDDLVPLATVRVSPDRSMVVDAEILEELLAQAKRTNLLLEIIAGTKVPLKDVL